MMSRREITPTRLPARLTTNSRRTFSSAMSRAAAVTDAESRIVMAGEVMSIMACRPDALCQCARRSRLSSGLRVLPPSYSSLATRSVSVTTPTGRPLWSTTGRPLILCSVMRVTSSLKPVLSCAVTTSFVITDSTVGSHIVVPPFRVPSGLEVLHVGAPAEIVDDVTQAVVHRHHTGHRQHGPRDELRLAPTGKHTVHCGRAVVNADTDCALGDPDRRGAQQRLDALAQLLVRAEVDLEQIAPRDHAGEAAAA